MKENIYERLLTPAETAELFGVRPETVKRWAVEGRLSSTRTLGGHRRFRESEVLSRLEDGFHQAEEPE